MNISTVNDLIEFLKSNDLVLNSVDSHPVSSNTAYVFRGCFESGHKYDLYLNDRLEIQNLKRIMQDKLNSQYSLVSTYREFTKLRQGEKYTMVTGGEMGFVRKTQFVFDSLKFGRYAQYHDSVQVIFKVRRKRNLSSIQFYGIKSFIIWEGFVDPVTDMYGAPKLENGLTVRRSKYLSFDLGYFTDALNSVTQNPLICKIDNERNG
jgi:hypothetical protein